VLGLVLGIKLNARCWSGGEVLGLVLDIELNTANIIKGGEGPVGGDVTGGVLGDGGNVGQITDAIGVNQLSNV
jgi:hypothetical protein